MRTVARTLMFAVIVLFVGMHIPQTAGAQEIRAGEVARIDKRLGWEWINIRFEPSIFATRLGQISLCNSTKHWSYCTNDKIKFTGNIANGWIELEYKPYRWSDEKIRGWIMGDFVEIDRINASDPFLREVYEPLTPTLYVITRDSVVGRTGPHISRAMHVHYYNQECDGFRGNYCDHTFKKGELVTIAGKQGNWLEIIGTGPDGEAHAPSIWVYRELVQPL